MTDYDAVGYVLSSDNRTEVLDAIDEGPATPSHLTEMCEPEIAHVSRALQELREMDMVELLVSEDVRKGRIHGITDYGSDVIESCREMSEGPS